MASMTTNASLQTQLQDMAEAARKAATSLGDMAMTWRNVAEKAAAAFYNAVREQYVAAGEPFGPADNFLNVAMWLEAQRELNRARWAKYDAALRDWAVASTAAQVRGEPVPPPPEEPV